MVRNDSVRWCHGVSASWCTIADMEASVVVVDDDDDIASLLMAGLRREQISCARAVNGEEGIRVIREQHPRVVLLDWMMPIKDGLQVCAEIRADHTLPQPHVILLTARAGLEDQEVARRAGVDTVITKPFRIREVLEQIRHHL